MPPKRQASKKSTANGVASKKGCTTAPNSSNKRAAAAALAEETTAKKRKIGLDSQSILPPQASTGRVLRSKLVKDPEMNVDDTSACVQETSHPIKEKPPSPPEKDTVSPEKRNPTRPVKGEPKSITSQTPKRSASVKPAKDRKTPSRIVRDLTVVEIPHPYDSDDSPTSIESTYGYDDRNGNRMLMVTPPPTLPTQQHGEKDSEGEEENWTTALPTEKDDSCESDKAIGCAESTTWREADRVVQASVAKQVKESLDEDGPEQEDGSSPDVESAADSDDSSGDDANSETEEVLSRQASIVVDSFDKPHWHSLQDIKTLAQAMNRLHAVIEAAGSTKRKTLQNYFEPIVSALDDLSILGYLLMAKSITEDDEAHKERLVERVEHHMEFSEGCTKGVLGTDELYDLLKGVIVQVESA